MVGNLNVLVSNGAVKAVRFRTGILCAWRYAVCAQAVYGAGATFPYSSVCLLRVGAPCQRTQMVIRAQF